MLILLEGCDKSGKSTLARKLVDEFGAEYVKFSQPKRLPYEEYAEFLAAAIPSKLYVLDRFMHGELVYGPIYRGKSGLDIVQLMALEKTASSVHGAAVIYCRVPSSQVKKKFIEDNEEFTQAKDIGRIIHAYDCVFEQTILKVFKYDYTVDGDAAKLLEDLRTFMLQSKGAA